MRGITHQGGGTNLVKKQMKMPQQIKASFVRAGVGTGHGSQAPTSGGWQGIAFRPDPEAPDKRPNLPTWALGLKAAPAFSGPFHKKRVCDRDDIHFSAPRPVRGPQAFCATTSISGSKTRIHVHSRFTGQMETGEKQKSRTTVFQIC